MDGKVIRKEKFEFSDKNRYVWTEPQASDFRGAVSLNLELIFKSVNIF